MGPGSPLTPKLEGVEKYLFQIAAKRLELDQNVIRARLMRHFRHLNLCLEQSYSFRQSPKWVNADRTMITVVVMTLLFFLFMEEKNYFVRHSWEVSVVCVEIFFILKFKETAELIGTAAIVW